MIPYYYYQGQLRKYLLQFCNVFVGLQVQTGKGECDVPEFMSVPIRIGSRDRVAAAIEAGNTQNKPLSIPMMAATMTGIALAPTRKGIGVVDRRTYLPTGGVWPADLKSVTRVMPIPYIMTVDLSLFASNTDQLHQILEQLLVLFDPALQIQTSDGAFDWTKITEIMLTNVTNEENMPPGNDRRIIVWTLTFEMPIYISTPLDLRDEVVRKIFIRLGDMDGFVVDEYDDAGNLQPFRPGYDWGTIEVDGT